jgi:hypothetical protein
MYYGDCYKEREHLKYLVVDKRILLKLSSLDYGKCKVNMQSERGGKNISVTLTILEPRCQETVGDEN